MYAKYKGGQHYIGDFTAGKFIDKCPLFQQYLSIKNKPRMVNAPEGLNIIISLAHEKNA